MSPYFNLQTGEMRDADDDLDTGTPDASAPSPAEPSEESGWNGATEPALLFDGVPQPTAPSPPTPGGWTISPTMTAVEARREFDRLRSEWIADPRHVLGDERHREHAAALAHYSALGALADGRDPAEGEEVLGEVFANGQIRAPGADALSPAPRPALPEGHTWDEATLVIAETEAHAMGARPSLIMEITSALAEITERSERRGGVGWSEAEVRAELERRHGRDGMARLVGNAQYAYHALLESEQPLLVQRVRELGDEWGEDPGVITLFGTLIYDALSDGPVTPAKEALLLRRGARQRKAEEAAQAAAAKRRQDEAAEGDEARAAFMSETAATHRRWGRVEP